MKLNKIPKIGIIGTGFIGSGLKRTIDRLSDMEISCILSQRNRADFHGEDRMTDSIDELIDKSDLIVECNGNPVYATSLVKQALEARLPVVTMDAELHITSGTYLSSKGLITEAEGDQPGALAALKRNLVGVGFKPLVYGNLKGFLNQNPSREDMEFWSQKQGISLEQVTGATDGTKVQIEQAFVANGLGAEIAKRGLLGYESDDLYKGAEKLARFAKDLGKPISDYLLRSPQTKQGFPAGVFITAEFEDDEIATLDYLKLGKGPFYTLLQNYHLIYLDIPRTIREIINAGEILINNGSNPKISVCAIAKRALNQGTLIKREDRNFLVRGEAIAIKDAPNHVPIGLLYDVVITKTVDPGQMLTFDDVELKESDAHQAWKFVLERI